jgi:glycosyltransferase involved in cell wall biosynthesis
MNIAVDATCWPNTRGYGRHARALLTHLVRLDGENRYTFVTDWPAAAPAPPPGVVHREVAATTPTAAAAVAGGRRSIRDVMRVSRALSDPSFTLVLFPTIYTYVPILSRAKKLIFFHDAIAASFPALTFATRGARLLWRMKERLGLWQADAVITVSAFSRGQIAARFGMPAERIFVVGEAADPIFRVFDHPQVTARLKPLELETRRVVVYLGGFGPHKNLPLLLRSFGALARDPAFADVRLLLVGEYEREAFYSEQAALRQQVQELGLDARVCFTGYLPDEDLVVLLNLATVLVLPSLVEGFGLPAVEAAACGCPVIATRQSPLPQLLGEGALYIDPHDPEDLWRALVELLESETKRERIRVAGLESASRLTWEGAAHQLLAIIRDVGTI